MHAVYAQPLDFPPMLNPTSFIADTIQTCTLAKTLRPVMWLQRIIAACRTTWTYMLFIYALLILQWRKNLKWTVLCEIRTEAVGDLCHGNRLMFSVRCELAA